jgi:EmrB/QacA subfamily drug resistance transporter
MPAPAASAAERRAVLVAAMVAAFLIPFSGSALNLAVPLIARDFNMHSEAANWILTVYLISSAVALVPLGRAGDLLGRRRVFAVGFFSFFIFSLLCGFASGPVSLLVLRGLQGISGAAIFGTSMALLTSVYPASERGRVLGLNVASVYTGLSVGPVAGGFLTHNLGWRSVFIATALLGVPALLFVHRLRTHRDESGKGIFDVASVLLYVGGLAALMHGMATLRSVDLAPVVAIAGAALITGFVARQFRSSKPLVELRVFRNPVFALSNLAALIHYSATFASGYLVSLYLQIVKGVSPQRAGLVLLIQPVLMALLSPVSGRMSDRVQPRLLASAGMGLTFLGLALFAFLQPDTPTAVIMLNLAFIGMGFALFSSPNTNAVMSSVERADYGVAASVLGTMRLLGQAFSMVLVNLFFSMRLGRAALAPENAAPLLASMKLGYVFFALLCLVGIAPSLARGRVRRQ